MRYILGDIRLGRYRNDMMLAQNPPLRRGGAMSLVEIACKPMCLPLHQGILSQNFKSSPYKIWSLVRANALSHHASYP